MHYTAVFVCQKGFIEIQSLFLAISTRNNLVGDPQIVAAHPKNLGGLSDVTKEVFQSLGVEIVEFVNDFRPEYCMANKPLACNAVGGNILFLDSDLICMKSFSPESLPDSEVVCFCEDPYLSYSENEWRVVADFFGVEIPTPVGINQNAMNTPMVFMRSDTLPGKWLEFTRRLHNAVSKGEITLARNRKISNLAFGMAVRAMGISPYIEPPITWDRDPNWWLLPKCNCHDWEKKIPIEQRVHSQLLCAPDHVYFYRDNNLECLGIPYFIALQNGGGYCNLHQGRTNVKRKAIGLGHYPEIRSKIYGMLAEFPVIDQHPYWNEYYYQYLDNTNTQWFRKSDEYIVPKKRMI